MSKKILACFLMLALFLPQAAHAAPQRTYKKITEGDTITGETTHYCVCMKCCGKLDGITASGLEIKNGMEDPYIVACNWLPLGTVIKLNGTYYTVQDRGGKGLKTIGRLDIFVPAGHDVALELGREYDVEIVIVEFPEVEDM